MSSMVHTSGKMNWDDLHYQKKKGSYNGMTAYNQSKLANVLHGAELAKRTESEGIHVYTLHPGNTSHLLIYCKHTNNTYCHLNIIILGLSFFRCNCN